MTFSDLETGGVGTFAYAVESIPGGSGTPGTPVVPNLFVPALDRSDDATFEQVQQRVMRGTRMTKAVSERGFLKVTGKVDFLLNASLGLDFYTAGFGATANLSAVAAVTTTATVTTANGVSTITVVGSFTPGAWVYLNTDNAGIPTATTEYRQVLPQSTAGSLVVGALTVNATAASGMYVTQPAQKKYANSLLSGANLNKLPTLTTEDNSGDYAIRYPGVYVDTLDISMGRTEMRTSVGLMGSADPIYESSGVTYAPPSADEKNALRPFTAIDGQIVAGGDPDATGTSQLRAAYGVTDVKIAFKNALIESSPMNGSHTMLVTPGDNAECGVDFTELSTSKRNDVYTDYIKASKMVALCAGAVKDLSATTTPNPAAIGFYVPNGKFTATPQDTKIGSINQWNRKFECLAPAGGPQDYIQAFVVSPT